MSSWFSKVFKPEEGEGDTVTEEPRPSPAVPKTRKVVQAPVTLGDGDTSAYSDDIRIKAKLDEQEFSCTFMVDRPVLAGLSCWAPDRESAEKYAPLAKGLFDLGGVAGVLIHDMTVTVIRDPAENSDWAELSKAVGAELRAGLQAGVPALTQEFVDNISSEEDLRNTLQEVIDGELNPAIASHSGYISLNRVEGNTVFITMGGGCQGCAASAVTLRQGVHTSFREAAPCLGAILDETDHAAGKNPFFREMPAEMGG